MLITLSKPDAHQSQLLGADTVKLCEMQGFSPRLENAKQSRTEANIWGFKAEFAVARLLDLEPPTLNVLSDGGIDLWYGDTSIDVKFTNKEHGPLIFDTHEKFRADLAILVGKVGGDTLRINGWIDRKTFCEKATKADFGYGPRYKMEVIEMAPIEKLWKGFAMSKFAENKKSIH